MTFLTTQFALFFAIILVGNILLRNNKLGRNLLIALAGIYFYSQFSLNYTIVLLSVLITTYLTGLFSTKIKEQKNKNRLTTAAVSIVGAMLIYFKYAGFIFENFSSLFTFEYSFESVILPVGLSFYVFSCIGYIVDINRKIISAETNPIYFTACFAFFPQLLSGPIVDAKKQLPQFQSAKINIDLRSIFDGASLFVWGAAKKLLIADTAAKVVAYIFAAHTDLETIWLWYGVFLYSIQVYCDFSGYSDMAIGISKMLGIKLDPNFNKPYMSKNPIEFWRRWHMSLTRWLKDYIYIPLGGRGKNKAEQYRNIMVVFAFSGLWHGANWTYLFWGILNGFYFLAYLLYRKIAKPGKPNNRFTIKSIPTIVFWCGLIALSRVLFRSPDLETAMSFFGQLLGPVSPYVSLLGGFAMLGFGILMLFEWFRSEAVYPVIFKQPIFQLAVTLVLTICIYFFAEFGNGSEYIYFNF